MSIYVKTENVNDATVQVHIAFENAGRGRPSRKRRATREFNRSAIRSAAMQRLSLGRNVAERQSTTKSRFLKHPNEEIAPAPTYIAAPEAKRLA